MKGLEQLELFKDLIQQAIDKGATSVEQIHNTVVDVPFDVMTKLGIKAQTAQTVKQVHKQTIGSIYNTVRKINKHVGDMANDIFELIEDGKDISKILAEKKPGKK